jgi:hypothetical protein
MSDTGYGHPVKLRLGAVGLVVAAVVMVATSCGSDTTTSGSAASTPASSIHAVSAAFTNVTTGYPTWAATDRYAVGFAGTDLDDPSVSARLGRMSLASGKIAPLDLPKIEGATFVPLSILSGTDRVLLVGVECDRLPTQAEPMCAPGRLSVWSIAPASGVARRIVVDAALSSVHVQDVEQSQRNGRSWRVVLGTFDPSGKAAAKVAVVDIASTGVDLVRADLPRATRYCTTNHDLHSLTIHPGRNVAEDGKLALTKVSLAGGAAVDLPMPEVNATHGGVTVQLACGGDDVFMTSAGTDSAVDAPHLFVLDGATWHTRPELVPKEAVTASMGFSTDKGAVFVWGDATGGAMVTATGDGAPSGSDPIETSGTTMAWRGSTDALLVEQIDATDAEGGEVPKHTAPAITIWRR